MLLRFLISLIWLTLVFCIDKDSDDGLRATKLELWKRGHIGGDTSSPTELWTNFQKLGPIRKIRVDVMEGNFCLEAECDSILNKMLSMRGGSDSFERRISLDEKLVSLGQRLGTEFIHAVDQNKREHEEDCRTSCESFYCAPKNSSNENWNVTEYLNGTHFELYNFGGCPPEDFSEDFGFPLDLIKVSKGNPLFSKEEAARVISIAEAEGVAGNEFPSGKYKLGGDWLTNLPNTRHWFNTRLESTFFPLLSHLFPEIVSSPSVLRAHSVSLLKYNASHPRTDVHIDNGILAMTLAMTPSDEYVGGGTFFEHMGVDNILEMDVGHGTFRPGSVRHGGHKVTSGTRYILGAFLLIEDRVEHVRRMKNRGSELRQNLNQDLDGAAKHFEWALAINPKCTTCMKDLAEVRLAQNRLSDAEHLLRKALELLEKKDSDALFSLGVVLSEAGKDEESIDAYMKSVRLNADDAELCYNLGIKLGARGDLKSEMAMYAKAVSVDPKFGGGWLNWGTSLAESGNFEDAEVMFLKAIECPEVSAKAMMNLGLLYQKKAEITAADGNLEAALDLATKSSNLMDRAKPLLDSAISSGAPGIADDQKYIAQFTPLRLQSHRILGSVYAGMKNFEACEKEFRMAISNFPNEPNAYNMLARVLEIQGKDAEAQKVRAMLHNL